MDDVPIRPGSPLEAKTLRDADIGRRTGVIVIAVKRADGRVEFPPAATSPSLPATASSSSAAARTSTSSAASSRVSHRDHGTADHGLPVVQLKRALRALTAVPSSRFDRT